MFIAIKITPGPVFLRIQESLKSILGNEKINWVDLLNIHLTLAFLGDTEDEMIKVASIVLSRCCTRFESFRFSLRGTGVFRNFRDPRIVWIGIEKNAALAKLYDLINAGLKDAGFALEDRTFSPHITLGRIKSVRDASKLKESLVKYKDADIQDVIVKEVILFESILKPSGPQYREIGKFRLSDPFPPQDSTDGQ